MTFTILQVGMGMPLHCMKDIRSLYKNELWLTTPIDFYKLATPSTHACVFLASDHLFLASSAALTPCLCRMVM